MLMNAWRLARQVPPHPEHGGRGRRGDWDAYEGIRMAQVHARSLELTRYMMYLIDTELAG